eukprot:3830571-Prymnesium_polylepis.1
MRRDSPVLMRTSRRRRISDPVVLGDEHAANEASPTTSNPTTIAMAMPNHVDASGQTWHSASS